MSSARSSPGGTSCTRVPSPRSARPSCGPCGRSSSPPWGLTARPPSRPTWSPATSGWARRSRRPSGSCCGSSTTSTTSCSCCRSWPGCPTAPVGVELICVGSFPGRPDFHGLGELEPEELASLWPVRTPVTSEHVRAARAGWDVFRATDPRGIERASNLPRRAAAVRRARPAAAARGAARSARRPLADRAPVAGRGRGGRAHARASVRGGDGGGGRAVPRRHDGVRAPRRARGRAESRSSPPAPSLALTAAGADVLAGRADRVALNGFDRWLGGLHLRAERRALALGHGAGRARRTLTR